MLKQLIKKNPQLYRWVLRFKKRLAARQYQRWYSEHNSLNPAELSHQRAQQFKFMPLVSLVVPVYNPPAEFLVAMLESVLAQTYANWELCLADGASSPATREILQHFAQLDRRIKVKFLATNLHISGNSNQALELATGEYIGLLDHDDLLATNCLFEFVSVINSQPSADLLYCDEDFYAAGRHLEPHFKPDFAPDSLRESNYITHLIIFKRELLMALGQPYFREEFQGAQDYDLILRLSEQAKLALHLPKILYHWRMHANSSLGNPISKNYAFENGAQALAAHLVRIGRVGQVRIRSGLQGIYKIDYELLAQPLVSIIIPNKDNLNLLKNCLRSIAKLTTYPNYEILIVENNSQAAATFDFYNQLSDPKIRVIYYPEVGFNFSRINNFAEQHAHGEYLLFLNNDTRVITPRWIEELLMYAQFADVGAVGAKLLFPNNTLQHAGVAISGASLAGNLFDSIPRNWVAPFTRTHRVQNLAAVTAACLLVARAKFVAVGGFDEELAVAFNDVDLCLKLGQAGFRCIFNPDAELYHYESRSRGYENNPAKLARFNAEHNYFKGKWGESFHDPYYPQAYNNYNYTWK